jgi:hypothetical protein
MDENKGKAFLDNVDKSITFENFMILISNLYKSELRKISILEEESILYKKRKIYANFSNYKILKLIKNELKNKIFYHFEKMKMFYSDEKDATFDLKERFYKIGIFLKFIKPQFDNMINSITDHSNFSKLKIVYITNYATNKIKNSLSNYSETFQHNSTIEIKKLKALNCLEMIKTFSKYFIKKVNQKIVTSSILKKVINNDETILDNILIITPENEVDIDGIKVNNKLPSTGAINLFYSLVSSYSQIKIIQSDKEIIIDKFIHFLDRRGIDY